VLIPLGDLAAGGENRIERANVLAVIENHYVRPIDREQLAEKTIDAMLAELDPYCEWIRPDEADRIRQAAHGRIHGPRQPTVCGWYNAREERTTDWCDEDAKIGYLRIDAFGADTPREVRAALFRLAQAEATGVVLDLRANHGGLLAAGVEVADLFVAEGAIVYVTGRGGERQLVPAKEDHTNREMPIVVLVGRDTASAAEVVAASLQDSGRAVVCGERSRGKGSVQSLLDLSGGGMLKLTTALFQRPRGTGIDRTAARDPGDWGVAPNAGLEVGLTDAQYRRLANRWYDGDEAEAMVDGIENHQVNRAAEFLRKSASPRPRNDVRRNRSGDY
jgi:C-terminal processing protease CtpA/Prc